MVEPDPQPANSAEPTDHTDTTVSLSSEDRAERLIEWMRPLHKRSKADRQAQLDDILSRRNYGGKK